MLYYVVPSRARDEAEHEHSDRDSIFTLSQDQTSTSEAGTSSSLDEDSPRLKQRSSFKYSRLISHSAPARSNKLSTPSGEHFNSHLFLVTYSYPVYSCLLYNFQLQLYFAFTICADLTFALYAFFHHILKSRITMFIEWYHGSALPQSNVPCLKHERSQKRLNKVVLRYSMPTLFLSPHRFVLSCYRHFANNNAKISVKRSIQCWLSC